VRGEPVGAPYARHYQRLRSYPAAVEVNDAARPLSALQPRRAAAVSAAATPRGRR
jgi:hypothetical protein